jgi:hypothetical protein
MTDGSASDQEVPGLWLSGTVKGDQRLSVPDPFQEKLFQGGPADRSAYWGREESRDLAVLSTRLLEKENFTTILKPDDRPEPYFLDGNRVLIADEITETTAITSQKGEILYLFSYGEMLEGDTVSAYVLTETQCWRLLPVEELAGVDEGLSETVLRKIPGFMSPPK